MTADARRTRISDDIRAAADRLKASGRRRSEPVLPTTGAVGLPANPLAIR